MFCVISFNFPGTGNKNFGVDDILIKIFLSSRPGGNRTLDPMIKSHVLCQLSYGPFFELTNLIFCRYYNLFIIFF